MPRGRLAAAIRLGSGPASINKPITQNGRPGFIRVAWGWGPSRGTIHTARPFGPTPTPPGPAPPRSPSAQSPSLTPPGWALWPQGRRQNHSRTDRRGFRAHLVRFPDANSGKGRLVSSLYLDKPKTMEASVSENTLCKL